MRVSACLHLETDHAVAPNAQAANPKSKIRRPTFSGLRIKGFGFRSSTLRPEPTTPSPLTYNTLATYKIGLRVFFCIISLAMDLTFVCDTSGCYYY